MTVFFRLLMSAFAVATLAACGSSHSLEEVSVTGPVAGVNMGAAGNASAAAHFEAYKQKAGGCLAQGHQRVLVTGFGLFYGVSYNISGFVVDNMRSEKFWPSEMKLSSAMPKNLQTVASGKLTEADQGASVVNRTLTIDGRTFDFCFLLADVRWDLAAAIIVYEMQRFQPDLVVMSGLGSDIATFEGGAQNQAISMQGFRSDGEFDNVNKPIENYVLPPMDSGVQSSIAMTWDNKAVLKASQGLIGSLGLSAQAPAQFRADNNYVCNNVAFVVSHAVKGVALHLAGGEISLTPNIQSHPQVGFFHYPANSSRSSLSVFTWSKVLATTVLTALK